MTLEAYAQILAGAIQALANWWHDHQHVPRAAVVGEAMIALALADQLLHTFGGDTIGDLQAAVRRRRARSRWPRGGTATALAAPDALPDNAAAEATPVTGTDA